LHRIKNIAIVWLVFRVVAFASAQETNAVPPDKSAYNLFNPVPDDLMRELTPDRPDKTESPYTVDAGHYQLEMDFANYTYNESGGTTTRAWNLAPFNLKAGLLNNVDLQFVFDNYLDVRTESRAASTTQSGVGGFTTRLKINLCGDDGGRTAFALLPFVKFPTSTDNLGNHAVEGGVIFPLAVRLPDEFDLGLETAVSCLRDDNDSNYHADFINSITVDHAIIGKLSGFVEFFSDISTERHAGWVGTVDTGLEFLVAENVQLDCGCNFGVTQAADDYNPFAGITIRF
jgi:Putative MetA-pathway of phenol degradation